VIDYVDIHRDPQTGKCKGFAFIQYANTECAKAAVRDMNNLQIGSQRISVQTVSVTQKGEVSASEEFLYSAGNKTNLMNKLSHNAPSYSNLQKPPISTVSTPYLIMTNMFKMEGTTPAFF
jgi:RNA-binding protein 39